MKKVEISFKTLARNRNHDWVVDDSINLLSKEKLDSILSTLDAKGSIVLEHWIYCGGQAPIRRVFDDFDGFIDYLKSNANAGDAVDVWSLHDLINSENRLVSGKCPADDGTVPRGGAY